MRDECMATAGNAVGLAGLWSAISRMVIAAGLAVVFLAPARAEIVTHDLGGGLEARYLRLANMQRSNEEIRITGTCYSACTLYLGLANVCVTSQARLGFHGPSAAFAGLPLPAAEFERESHRMATHYPPVIREWFLREARYMTGDVYLLTGEQLIALGVKAC